MDILFLQTKPIIVEPEQDGSVEVEEIFERGVSVLITIEPENPNNPASVGVGPIAVKACAEGKH